MSAEPFPERLSLNGAAMLFRADRHRLAGWCETDARFPRPGADGRFETVKVAAYLELLRIEAATDEEIAAEGRASLAAILALGLTKEARESLLCLPLPNRAERVADCEQTISRPMVGSGSTPGCDPAQTQAERPE